MTILHINKFWDFHGGTEVYLHELFERQAKAGHTVHVLATKKPGTPASPDEASFVTYHAFNEFEGLWKDGAKAMHYLWNREAKRAVETALQTLKPDVVHLHNIYHHLSTSILAPIRAAHIPCVQTLHDYKLACPNYKMYTQNAPCERCKNGDYQNAIKFRCLGASLLPNVLAALEMGMTKAQQSYEKTVDRFLCPSQFMREKMIDWGEPAGKMRYVPNPTRVPAQIAARGGGYLFYAGRLSQEKGLKTVLSAMERVRDLPLWIAGRGPEEAALRAQAEALGLTHVRFLGFLPPAELEPIRAKAEAFLMPTQMYENASGAVMEAMAAGLPCLATAIGGTPELVEDGKNGFLVKPGDVDDWVRVLHRFHALSQEERNEMGKNGREKILAKHTWEQHLKTLETCYTSP